MTDTDCDLFVIGGGSGGVRAARIASLYGARVVLAEKGLVGGTCVHAGCVPKKLLVFAAEHGRSLRRASSYGFESQARVPHSWSALLQAVHAETDRLGGIYEHRLREAGVAIERGVARVTGAHEVELNGRKRSARHILVATGAMPFVPDIVDRSLVLTSDDVFRMPELPARIAIVGGGYIGLELAGVFAGLGAHVTLLHRGEALLSSAFDRDVRSHIARELPLHGIDLRLRTQIVAVEETASGARELVLSDANGTRSQHDAVIFATGRKPQTAGLGLEAIGVELDADGAIRVDAYSQSSVPSVHAIGDVTGRLELTPVAIAEGHALADTLFGSARRSAHAMLVPTAVFSEPEIGMVGETEDAARARGAEIDVYRDTFRALEHALDGSRSRALVKLVVDRSTQKVLGCHVVAPHAGEIVQGFAAAISAGLTKAQLDATVGIHPTVGEELLTLRRPVSA